MLTPTVDISKAAIVLLNHSVIDKSASQGVMLGEARSKLYRVGQTSEPDWFLNKLCWNVCQLECGPINAQRDGRPAYYRWRRLFNGAVWLTPTIRVPCSNAGNMRNPLKFAGVPQTRQQISAVSRPKFAILLGHVEEVLLLNKFFSDCGYVR